MKQGIGLVAVSLVLTFTSRAVSAAPQGSMDPLTTLYAATAEAQLAGNVVKVQGGRPWQVTDVGASQGALFLRQFGKFLFVVNTQAGTVQRMKIDGSFTQQFDLGSASEPQDANAYQDRVYVTRRNHTFLRRISLLGGVQTDVVDLGVLAEPGETVTLRTMERSGARLFVQVGLDSGGSFTPNSDRGVLAVVDLTTETLIDVDPTLPGVQGVKLFGAPPRFKMQILEHTLYVSTTDSLLDERGGIEMVDLDSLTSVGYALAEASAASDMGGFVMTSPCGGFFVFHTDITPSTHLKPFTVSGGMPPGPEIVVLVGDQVDSIGYDPYGKRIFLPTGFSDDEGRGLLVFDAITHQQIGTTPIDTGERPHDVVVAR